MKLTCAFILLACLHVSAGTYSQDRITLKLGSADIRKVLSAIEKKSAYRFLFNESIMANKPRVSINVTNAEITTVLNDICLNNGIAYHILKNNLIVLREASLGAEMVIPDINVSGKVTGPAGEPLTGVSVSIKGTQTGTTTDPAGNYSLTVPDQNAILVFSYVGYGTQELRVGEQTTLNVTLSSTTRSMDEVVVIGYGTASKRDLTGSIVKVLGRDIADKPNVNPLASLQGKASGVSVVNNGNVGEDPDIRIRGTISINSVRPLYVVDGILNDDIKFLNPNDIESMEILKDPSSLAIFGNRGAAGVIIVTTKKAKAGQVTINFNSTVGVKKLEDKIDVVNAADFKMLLNEEANNRILDNAGDLGLRTFIDNNLSKWTADTDWQDVLTRKAFFTMNNVSVAAASEKNRFYMGIGYSKDEGIVRRVELEKLQLSINDEYRVNKNIKVGFQLNGSKEDLPYDANGPLSDARRIAPIVQPYFETQGLYGALPNIQQTLANPLLVIENNWNRQPTDRYRLVGSVFGEVTFLKNFTARANLYMDWSNQRGVRYTPLYNAWNPDGPAGTGTVQRVSVVTRVTDEKIDIKKYQQDYVLTYKKNFGDHGVTATYGFETYYYGYERLKGQVEQKANGDPIPDNDRFWYIDNGFGDPSSRISTSFQYEKAQASHLARVLYNFQNKYFLNASFRRDGSYAFYKNGNAWENFYAFGAAWDLSRENFMATQTFFNALKVKGSYGVLGNQNVSDENQNYPLYPALQANTSPVFGQFVYPAYSQAYLPDANLRWERIKGTEVGFELNALGNRLFFEALYYRKVTDGFLVLTPGIGGALPGLRNVGDAENKGFEFSGSYTQNLGKDLSLTVSGNLSTLRNEILRLSDTGYKLAAGETNPNQTEAGYPIGYFYGFVADGVYQNAADIAKVPVSISGGTPLVGDVRFKDVNGDGKITDNDRTMIGNPTPSVYYGGSVNLNYKGFNFGVDVNGVAGNEIYRVWGTSENQFSLYNYAADKLGRWRGEGTSNTIPILNNGRKINRLPSTLGIESGSYFRIRNIQLGYNFPPQMLSGVHIKAIRLFVNVQNLKTFRKNTGYSPEFGGAAADPNRPGTANTAAIAFGIDNADFAGALPRIITGGINVTF